MKTFLRRIFFRIFKRYEPLQLAYVTYGSADTLIRNSAQLEEDFQWHISKHEDLNPVIGMVWIWRRRRITE